MVFTENEIWVLIKIDKYKDYLFNKDNPEFLKDSENESLTFAFQKSGWEYLKLRNIENYVPVKWSKVDLLNQNKKEIARLRLIKELNKNAY